MATVTISYAKVHLSKLISRACGRRDHHCPRGQASGTPCCHSTNW